MTFPVSPHLPISQRVISSFDFFSLDERIFHACQSYANDGSGDETLPVKLQEHLASTQEKFNIS